MRTAFIISLLLIVPLNALAAEPGNVENDVVRFYDLSRCLGPSEPDDGDGYHLLMPMAFKSDMHYEMPRGREAMPVMPEQIHNLVYALIGEEYFEHNGARIEVAENHLFVKCPDEVHRKVSAILEFLQNRLNQTVTVRIDVLDREAPLPAGMDAQALRQALDEGRIQPLFRRTAKVRIGDSFRIRSGEIHRVIVDYEPEIAESSTISEPIARSVYVGLDMEVKPMLAADGENVLMGLYGSSSRLVEPIAVREIKGATRLGTDSGLMEFATDNVLDDPKVEFGSMGAALFLESGQPSLVRTAFPHDGGSGYLLFVISARLDGAAETLDLGQGPILAAYDLSHLHATASAPIRKGNQEEWGHDWSGYDPSEDISIMDLGTNYGRYEELISIFSDGDYFPELGFEEYAESMGWEVLERLFLFNTSPERFAAFKDLTRDMYQPFSEAVNVEVLFVEVNGPPILTDAKTALDRGAPRGAVSLPLMPGGRAISMAGLEGLMIHTYDVDVATKAAIMNPNITNYLDGAVVHLKHSPSVVANGTGRIQVQMTLNRMKGPMQSIHVAKYGGLIGIQDKPEFAHTLVDTTFPADGGTHLLGSLTLAGETGMKTLFAVGRVKK